jgi:hypothetical protein
MKFTPEVVNSFFVGGGGCRGGGISKPKTRARVSKVTMFYMDELCAAFRLSRQSPSHPPAVRM